MDEQAPVPHEPRPATILLPADNYYAKDLNPELQQNGIGRVNEKMQWSKGGKPLGIVRFKTPKGLSEINISLPRENAQDRIVYDSRVVDVEDFVVPDRPNNNRDVAAWSEKKRAQTAEIERLRGQGYQTAFDETYRTILYRRKPQEEQPQS